MKVEFDRFDTNGDGVIDAAELRLIKIIIMATASSTPPN